MRKNEKEELEKQTLKLVNAAHLPVTVDYVATQCHVAWDTARALLLGLACQKKITATKTMKSWIFKALDTEEK